MQIKARVLFLIAITILIIDTIYLYVIRNQWSQLVYDIQKEPMSLNYVYAGGAYMCMIIMIYHFLYMKNATYIEAFVLGALTYAIFDFTNLAIFNEYSVIVALQDIIWGGLLFCGVLYIVRYIEKNIKNIK